MLSCRYSIDLLTIFFFVSPLYTEPHEHFNSYATGQLFGINWSLFLHKKFFKLGPFWNTTFHPNFCISFLIFGPIFGIQGKVIVCFLSVLLLLLLLLTLHVFFFQSCYLSFVMFFDQAQYISWIFYFRSQIFFRTNFGSSCKKCFEYVGNCVKEYTKMWLNLYIR